MPADHLTRPGIQATPVVQTERAVLDVLAGTPLLDAAARVHLAPSVLDDAVDRYRCAGRQALREHAGPTDWWQVLIEFTDWHTAEATAARHLHPLLADVAAGGEGWWFIRKHPCWRIRLRADSTVKTAVGAALDRLVADGHLRGWRTGRYEPETAAFGGPTAMEVAHQLFGADSRRILDLADRGEVPLGRRELSVLLCTALLRGARLEWYEQGDVWDRVCQERPLPTEPAGRLDQTATALRTLLLADTDIKGPLFGAAGPLVFATDWACAFHQAGDALGTAALAGALGRGLRHVLSYHVIFHWNRLGLPTPVQAVLAHAARTAVLDPPTLTASTSAVSTP
ncbi:thiopeptide-type bacteriocin biosynthesis protein [Kitasatospora sp. NPDC088351]|uniref:thiopeptide-type bacteriocin biosynthesis protein n=1 Tax=Kitasatospora sp. NPDC088351 TaxID=3155180 RepID=UPI00343EC7D1